MELNILGFALQKSELWVLELFYTFFENFCDINKFQELIRVKGSLYLTLSEVEPFYCITSETKAGCQELQLIGCYKHFTSDALRDFLHHAKVQITKHVTRKNQVPLKKTSDNLKCFASRIKSTAVTKPLPTN